ncbi:expressed unknown protein [Seminavis robusta]|uniref:Uncharacterized protein n=1 Tax=Seminavis robusta TaxID=568900 RepID=A0A9N8F108_9STRA|nr:expressed unknown protein [Seminavis robusta]|eukprot:Sro2285_g321960.1 n/a (103) ;mRNA; f:7979-8287
MFRGQALAVISEEPQLAIPRIEHLPLRAAPGRKRFLATDQPTDRPTDRPTAALSIPTLGTKGDEAATVDDRETSNGTKTGTRGLTFTRARTNQPTKEPPQDD